MSHRVPNTRRRFRKDAGLTILELMIVLVILSLIGVVVAVQVAGQLDRAKVDIAKLQLRQLQNSLALFQIDMRRYPTADEGLEVLIKAPQPSDGWRGPYVKNVVSLADPWGHQVTYAVGENGRFVVGSMGADGKNGGEGAASDIELAEED